ncbi:MAG TPA: type II toxin-antitoxin system prevent-host-death family antitoxin [Longimicrobium sp.]|jgi:prevent-host-death family protein
MIVNVHAAKTQLSKLIERAIAGEEIVIARDSEPVVKLVAVDKVEPQRRFGALKGELVVPDEFFDPLPADELAVWEQ